MTLNHERVITYIDGFNLYFGLKSKGWKHYYWLDIHALSTGLLKPHQSLAQVKYFSSRISSLTGTTAKSKRQNTYLEALALLPDTRLFFGKYNAQKLVCPRCSYRFQLPSEKQTDVNIANELIVDSLSGTSDTAILVSGDSDLLAPVQTVLNKSATGKLIIAFPPDRVSNDLRRSGAHITHIGRSALAKSQLPERMVKPDGYVLTRPPEWR